VLPSHHAALFSSLRKFADAPHSPRTRCPRWRHHLILGSCSPPAANEDTAARLSQSLAQIVDFVFASGGPRIASPRPARPKGRTNPWTSYLKRPLPSRLPANSRAELIPGVAQNGRHSHPQNILAHGRLTGGI